LIFLDARSSQDIGRSLDRADQLEMQRTAQYSLENSRAEPPADHRRDGMMAAWRPPPFR